MLAKLRRELGRVASASSVRQDLVDHATNCALTAWHITDWVWRCRFARDKKAQQDLETSCTGLRNRSTLGVPGLGEAGRGGPGDIAGERTYRLKIRSEHGKTSDAIEVFNAVAAFWTEFSARHEIG